MFTQQFLGISYSNIEIWKKYIKDVITTFAVFTFIHFLKI